MADLNPALVPLSLYIHMPWCVRKCPYCDFNSHAVPDGKLSLALEESYLQALVADFKTQLDFAQGRQIHSVFIGGGTPSLISAQGYQWLFAKLKQLIVFEPNCEITLEANPGTLEHDPFIGYLQAGINRLSIGVQSFNSAHLQKLGRIHSNEDALNAIHLAQEEENFTFEDTLIAFKDNLDTKIWMLQAFLGKEALEDDDYHDEDED